MREIKFRGWDERNKEMVYNINLLFSNHLNECFEEYEECGLKIMQYTGLIDKNGKKIFEGDIVTAWSQGYQATGEVKQRIDGLWLMYPAYQHGKQWGLCPNPKGGTKVEIIGNIHEGVQE